MSEFEHRDKKEIERDNIKATLSAWTGILVLALLPSPMNVALFITLVIIFHDQVRVVIEWTGRAPGTVIKSMWDLLTYPIRLAQWAFIRPLFDKTADPLIKTLLWFIWTDVLLILWLLIWVTW